MLFINSCHWILCLDLLLINIYTCRMPFSLQTKYLDFFLLKVLQGVIHDRLHLCFNSKFDVILKK